MFKTLVPDTSFVDMLSSINGETLSIMNLENNTRMKATYLTHHKFSFPSHLSKDMDTTYKICIYYLMKELNINNDMFKGQPSCVKCGLIVFDNEYETSLRLWSSKNIDKMTVCNLTLAGYKGGVYVKNKN